MLSWNVDRLNEAHYKCPGLRENLSCPSFLVYSPLHGK